MSAGLLLIHLSKCNPFLFKKISAKKILCYAFLNELCCWQAALEASRKASTGLKKMHLFT